MAAPADQPGPLTPAPTVRSAGDSDRLLTASADSSVKLWELNTGKDLFTFKRDAPCVAVKLAVGDSMFAFTTAAFMAIPPTINIVRLESDLSEQSSKPVLTIEGPKGRITRVVWTDMNRTLVTCHEKGMLRRWDVEVRALP